jgi:hypothetical protein
LENNVNISSTRRPSLVYITPTFGRDIERFSLLRKSLNVFSPEIPHFVYVDTEDCSLFQKRFKDETNVHFIPTGDILPERLEIQRRLWRSWRGKAIERIGWRLGVNTRFFTGWKLQQILKLEALAECTADAGIFLDSDLIICGRIREEDFITSNNKLRLLETKACNYEDFVFEANRQILVGGSLLARAHAFNYIHQAPRFFKRTAASLIGHLSKVHKDWHSSFFHLDFPSEYALLGYAARELENYNGYDIEETPQQEWCYNVKERSDLGSYLELCRQESGKRKFLLIQSNLGIPAVEYISIIEGLIESFGK